MFYKLDASQISVQSLYSHVVSLMADNNFNISAKQETAPFVNITKQMIELCEDHSYSLDDTQAIATPLSIKHTLGVELRNNRTYEAMASLK